MKRQMIQMKFCLFKIVFCHTFTFASIHQKWHRCKHEEAQTKDRLQMRASRLLFHSEKDEPSYVVTGPRFQIVHWDWRTLY